MSARNKTSDRSALRRAICDTAIAMARLGLATGSSGNVSARVRPESAGMLITASGIPYERIRPEEIIEIDADGKSIAGDGAPSSEWRMHAAIYERRPDITAIVHTHSMYATAAAIALPELPIPHDEGRIFYGDAIPVSVHHPPGSWELARAVAEALGDGQLVLIAKHGAVAVAGTLDDALGAAVKIEEIAQLAYLARRFRGL